MPAKTLTQLTVNKLTFEGLADELTKAGKPPKTKRILVFDKVLPSFGLRVSEGGAKSYFLMTRLKNGKQVNITIGQASTWKEVDKARGRARDLLQSIARGEDPTAPPPTPPEVMTVKALCADFIERWAKAEVVTKGADGESVARVRNRSWEGTEALLANHVIPAWGNRDARSITRADVRKLMADLAKGQPDQPGKQGKKPLTVGLNRVFATLRKMGNWAVAEDLLETSPFDKLTAPNVENERDRALTDLELALVWRAAEAVGGFHGAFIKTLILTGQRRSEAAGMLWDDLDLAKGVWTLPREATKADRSHEVPLTPQALAALPTDRLGSFVFPGRRHKRKGVVLDVPISGFSKIKAVIDMKVAKALAKEAGAKGGDAVKPMGPWRLHDLRRTVGTGMARLGVPVGTISRVLNHAEGGVTKIYVRHGFLNEKRAALDLWCDHVQRLVTPKAVHASPTISTGTTLAGADGDQDMVTWLEMLDT